MKKVTLRKLSEWIREESKSAKEYKEYGLDNLAEDEARHHRTLKFIKKEMEQYL